MNIYDMAGNVGEWLYESTINAYGNPHALSQEADILIIKYRYTGLFQQRCQIVIVILVSVWQSIK